MKKIFSLLAIFCCAGILFGQQKLNSVNYVTVDNLHDNNTGVNGTILCDTTYCETGPSSPVSGDNNGWWSQIDVPSISYNSTVRLTPKTTGVSKPTGSKATYFFNVPSSGNYLVYTYIFASGNATSNAYITFKRFGEGLLIDSMKYDQAVHQVLSPSTAGCWVPWRIVNIFGGSRTFEVTIGADTNTQPYMRADAVRILKSTNNGPDLEFGRRAFNGYDSVRVVELFPAITFKFKEFYDKPIQLFNLGNATLIINNIKFSSTRFSVTNNLPITIPPGESSTLTLRFSPKGEETTNDSLQIFSNDLEEPVAYLPLRGDGINYNFIMNASEGGSEPHWNAPIPANYSEIGLWQTSTGRSPFVFPIAGGNLRSRYFPISSEIPVASYKFTIPDTLAGNYILEYGGPYSSNSTQTAVIEVVTPFNSDTMKVLNFNQNIPFGGEVWKRIADANRRIFPLSGGGYTTVNFTRTSPGSGVLRTDLLRIRLLPIAPTASTSLDNDGRVLSYGNVSIYDSIRLAEFNYQKTMQIRSNGEQPLMVDSISLTGRYSRFFKLENLPVTPFYLPAVDGTINLVISFLPKDTTFYDSSYKTVYDSVTHKDTTLLVVDTIIGGIRNYEAFLRFKTNDTINNKYITIRLTGSGVGNIIIADDSDPNTYVNTDIVEWNPSFPTQLNKWQRILNSGTANTRLFTYIYGYQYQGLIPDSNYIEWFPYFPKRPNGPMLEADSFHVYALLPAGSLNANPRAVYEINSPISGNTILIKNQRATVYGGDVPSNGRLYLGKYVFMRGGNDMHNGGTIFGNMKLLNNYSLVNDLYQDSLINSAMVDSHLTRADAIYIEQVTRLLDVNENNGIIKNYYLSNNYPNPFNPSTKIIYEIPNYDKVSLKIYDLLGREIKNIVNENQKPGRYEIIWDGKDNNGMNVSSGIYFYRIETKGFVKSKKMVLLK